MHIPETWAHKFRGSGPEKGLRNPYLGEPQLNQNHILRKPWGKFLDLFTSKLKKHNTLVTNLIFPFLNAAILWSIR